ncbi:MAG: hypothetical protein CM15mP103_01420 [Gammaproteobacteria bacterium]|nr:MAG: hypothetical protein CM15mP103_01420 [Gammaproteobacteria bacterium]
MGPAPGMTPSPTILRQGCERRCRRGKKSKIVGRRWAGKRWSGGFHTGQTPSVTPTPWVWGTKGTPEKGRHGPPRALPRTIPRPLTWPELNIPGSLPRGHRGLDVFASGPPGKNGRFLGGHTPKPGGRVFFRPPTLDLIPAGAFPVFPHTMPPWSSFWPGKGYLARRRHHIKTPAFGSLGTRGGTKHPVPLAWRGRTKRVSPVSSKVQKKNGPFPEHRGGLASYSPQNDWLPAPNTSPQPGSGDSPPHLGFKWLH